MKNLIYIYILISVNLFSQKKEKIIFLFNESKDNMFIKNSSEIYVIDKKHTFEYNNEKNEKIEVKYNSIKSNILTSYSEFIELNKRNKYPEYFDKYQIYIFIKEKYGKGCLIEVEKVWLVEGKIID